MPDSLVTHFYRAATEAGTRNVMLQRRLEAAEAYIAHLERERARMRRVLRSRRNEARARSRTVVSPYEAAALRGKAVAFREAEQQIR